MKKILSILVILCMLLSTFVLLTSCSGDGNGNGKGDNDDNTHESSGITKEDMKDDPATVLSDAMVNAGAKFFGNEIKLAPTISEAMSGGSLNVSFAADFLEEIDIGKISETIYVSEKDGKIVSDTLLNYNGEDLTARIFLDKDGIVASSNSVFGSDIAYGIFPATLAEKFTSSELAEMMGLTDAEAIAQVDEALVAIADAYAQLLAIDGGDVTELTDKLYNALGLSVSEKMLTTDEGNIKCIVASYSFNKNTLDAYFDVVIEELEIEDEELSAEINRAIAEITDKMAMNFDVNMYVNAESEKLEKTTVDGSVTISGTTMAVDAELSFSESAIAFVANMSIDGETVTASIELTKTKNGKITEYQLLAKLESDIESATVLDVVYAYDKSSGDYTLTHNPSELIPTNIVLSGNVSVKASSATLTLNSIEVDTEKIEFELAITFTKNAKIPETPANVKDVVELTAEDIERFVNDFENSRFTELFLGKFGDASEYPENNMNGNDEAVELPIQ